MPIILLAGGLGVVVGFVAGKGLDGGAEIIKWGAIGAGVYVAAKAFKVL